VDLSNFPLTDADKKANRCKSSVRDKIEHLFLMFKRFWDFAKVRYRDLAKNAIGLLPYWTSSTA